MNKIRTVLLGTAVFALSAFSVGYLRTPAYADGQATDPRTFSPRPGMHRMFGAGAPLISIALKHQTELNLTADQVSTFENIRTQYQNQTTPIVEQLRSVESEIRSLVQQSPANLVQIKLDIEQAEKLRSELRYLRIEALENGKSALTAAQQDQLKNLFTSMRQNFRRPQGQAS